MATAAMTRQGSRTRLVARFAWVVLGYFILVVLLGAVVRATDSGGGCGASWPLCNGDYFPHHPRIATIIEFTHRSTSGVCAFLTIALGLWTFRQTPPRHRARKAILWAAFFLVMEALLGAALVLNHWVESNVSAGRTIAQSIHFSNTLLLMAALTLTASFLREESSGVADILISKSIAWAAVVSTLAVGATGSLAALADTLFPSPTLRAGFAADFANGAPLLVRMRWLHPAAAVIATVCVLLLLRAHRQARRRLDFVSLALAALLASQFVLGGLDVLLLAPTWMQVLHLLGADLYWVALVVLAGRTIWPTRSIAKK